MHQAFILAANGVLVLLLIQIIQMMLMEEYLWKMETEWMAPARSRLAALQKFGEMDYLARSDALYEADSESYAEEVFD